MGRGVKFCIWIAIAGLIGSCKTEESSFDVDSYFGTLKLDSSTLVITEIASNLSVPWDLEMGPDGWLWFTEQKGIVSKVNPETGEVRTILQLENIYYRKSSGLFSMALHPDFQNEPYVFLHYTTSEKTKGNQENITSRLVRYHYDDDSLRAPDILIDSIPGNTYHNGSRMLVMEDKLFIGLGDAGQTTLTQNIDTYHGKILRINLDGSIPDDNPFPESAVWSIGHRNIQGFTTAHNAIYVSEHGHANDDEINLIVKAGNYGWPNVQGFLDLDSEFTYSNKVAIVEPLKTWTPTIAPSGIAYYGKSAIPEWHNSFLLTTLKGRSLRLLKLNNSGEEVVSEKVFLQKALGRMRDVIVSDDGDVYIGTSNTDWHPIKNPWMYDSLPDVNSDRILRIRKVDSQDLKKLSSLENPYLLGEDLEPLNLKDEIYDFTTTDEDINNGHKLYQQFCSACHRSDGKGNVGHLPPLVNSEWVTEDKVRLIDVMLRGLNSPIVVDGVAYHGEMPPYASLKNEEIRDILNFIRTEFGKTSGNVTSADVSLRRKEL